MKKDCSAKTGNTPKSIMPGNKFSKRRLSTGQIILIVSLTVVALIMMVPFIWSIIASFTSANDLEGNGFRFFYGAFTFENWIELFKNNWTLYIFNTLFIAFMEIFLQLLFCSMAAYAFAKYDFYGKKVLYKVMLFSMMLPGIVTLIPQFIVTTSLPFFQFDIFGNRLGPGLHNSLFGVILPNAVSIYGILFLRQFFTNLSDEIGDAARIDGASGFRVFMIYFKMALPGIMTLGLFTFVSTWSSYLWPSLILFDQSKFTLGQALQEYQVSASTGEMMAGSLISLIPIVVLFMFTQKYFLKQTTYTGIK